VDRGVLDGLYKWADAPEGPNHRATILFSGSANLAARKAQQELAEHFDVAVDLWSATSYKLLREDALEADRWNRLHPADEPRVPFVTSALGAAGGPVVAVTDFMRSVAEQIQAWVPRDYIPLGTDGFGRSDTREALRRFFETDTGHVVVAVLSGLVRDGSLPPETMQRAFERYGIDPEVAPPWRR
jgi:pyruvate dehydrogenase E1 component